eukprot:CAMPEP_0174748476 /NCGR_PEP_ID=MMETSP1094-20130205/93561_1 /TAXON_ID=156173 /ORGANISM="Chrysochromulina brevifilum, Strain UTEX LB 985" /LENGTH=375 /DNA_ID=CAMNT_0015953519 /DNA_START=33 /DNA_END=1160 /DNA_ORIENTATION=+
MATGDPHTTRYKQQMDSLNDFLKDSSIPPWLGVKARQFLRNTRELTKKASYDELITGFSPGLRGAILLHMSHSIFSRVWYLAPCDSECLIQLAGQLHQQGFPPRERMNSTRLNILESGIAARSGDLLYGGDCWGQDMILTAPVLRDTRLATALTYVEVVSLTRDELFSVLLDWPESRKIVQNAAVRMALKRTVLLLKAYADSQRAGAVASGAGDTTSSISDKMRGHGMPGNETGSSKAYSMLLSAFSPGETDGCEPGANDLGKIFRTITGSRLRDVDQEGNLVETVTTEASIHTLDSSTFVRKMKEADEERRMMRQEMGGLKDEVMGVHSTLRQVQASLAALSNIRGPPVPRTAALKGSAEPTGALEDTHHHTST